MRTFIAIDLDEVIKNELNFFIQELHKFSVNIRWAHSKGMHLTLKFLGETKEDQIHAVKEQLEKIATQQDTFTLNIKGTGWFPPGNRSPRILWAGCHESETLLELQNRIERELEKLDFPIEKRKYNPHLTLGRVRTNKNLDMIVEEFSRLKDKDFGSMKVKKVTLFQSILKPTGAEYIVLSEHELK
jgi:2'-5' RNA ligase